jgi:hypothetical protein
MKYGVKMGSGAMIKIVSGFQSSLGGDSWTHRRHGDLISTFSFIKNKKSRLKIHGSERYT